MGSTARRRFSSARVLTSCAVGVAVTVLAGCGTTTAREARPPGITTGAGVVAVPPATPTATAPTATATATAADLAALEVRRKTWGGLCPSGPCGSSLVVFGSGSWTLLSEGVHTQGTLTPADVAALSQAVRVTRLGSATGTADCAADHDGTSVAYAWTSADVTGSASSCDHPIDPRDPLVVVLERLAATIVP